MKLSGIALRTMSAISAKRPDEIESRFTGSRISAKSPFGTYEKEVPAVWRAAATGAVLPDRAITDQGGLPSLHLGIPAGRPMMPIACDPAFPRELCAFERL